MGVAGTAVLFGKELDTKRTTEIHCPIHFYEANITAQIIISYAWLAEQNLMVNPRRNSLYFQDTQICVTIQGMTPDDELKPTPRIDRVVAIKLVTLPITPWNQLESEESETESSKEDQEKPVVPKKNRSRKGKGKKAQVPPPFTGSTAAAVNSSPLAPDPPPDNLSGAEPLQYTPFIPPNGAEGITPLRVLDLFSGTGSIAKIFRARGYEFVTLHKKPLLFPRHLCRYFAVGLHPIRPGSFLGSDSVTPLH